MSLTRTHSQRSCKAKDGDEAILACFKPCIMINCSCLDFGGGGPVEKVLAKTLDELKLAACYGVQLLQRTPEFEFLLHLLLGFPGSEDLRGRPIFNTKSAQSTECLQMSLSYLTHVT